MRDLMKWMRDLARDDLIEMREGAGVAVWVVPNLDKLVAAVEDQAEALRHAGDTARLLIVLKRLGFLHWVFTEDLDKAISAFRERQQKAETIGDDRAICTSLDALATLHSKRDETDQAFDILARLEDTCRQAGDLEGLGYALEGQTNILVQRNQLEAALDLCRRWQAVCEEHGDTDECLKASQMAATIEKRRSGAS